MPRQGKARNDGRNDGLSNRANQEVKSVNQFTRSRARYVRQRTDWYFPKTILTLAAMTFLIIPPTSASLIGTLFRVPLRGLGMALS